MKFSVSLPLIRDRSGASPYEATFRLAVAAEEAGFDTATLGHHHFLPGNAADPLTVLAGVAARTSRLRLGTGIFQLPFHHPVRVAEQVATLDELSGGRVTFGVGLGWWDLEYRTFGADLSDRGARMEEALQILRHVWTHPETSWSGRFWSFDDLTVHPRPIQQPHPPLWVAGVADAAVDRAARLGDAWICGPVQSLAVAQACLARYRDARRALGEPGQWVLRRFAWVEPDRDRVRRDVLPRYVEGLLAHWRESAEDDAERAMFAPDGAGVPDAETLAEDRLLWGDPDQVIAQIERCRDATGCDHVHVAFGAGLPADSSDRDSLGSEAELAAMIRLFGREVIDRDW